jgi:hypothetical protein
MKKHMSAAFRIAMIALAMLVALPLLMAWIQR